MESKELSRKIYSMIPAINYSFFRNLPVADIPKQQLRLLYTLEHHNHMPMKHFSEKMYISKSNLTKLVDHLIEQGWVVRSHSKKDRRVVLLSITDKGREEMKNHIEKVVIQTSQLFDVLTEEERESLNNHFEEILKLLDKINPPQDNEERE